MIDLKGWAPKDYPIRLRGHSLINEAGAFVALIAGTCDLEECAEPFHHGGRVHAKFGGGHARCTCGAESPHLPSGGQRKAWHRDHKRVVAESRPGRGGCPVSTPTETEEN